MVAPQRHQRQPAVQGEQQVDHPPRILAFVHIVTQGDEGVRRGEADNVAQGSQGIGAAVQVAHDELAAHATRLSHRGGLKTTGATPPDQGEILIHSLPIANQTSAMIATGQGQGGRPPLRGKVPPQSLRRRTKT